MANEVRALRARSQGSGEPEWELQRHRNSVSFLSLPNSPHIRLKFDTDFCGKRAWLDAHTLSLSYLVHGILSNSEWWLSCTSNFELENRICRQIQDVHVRQFWHKREKEAQRLFVKLNIHSLFFFPGGRNLPYFRSTGSGFRDTRRFSKLPYLGMKLGHWKKFLKLHTHSLSATRGGNWAYFLFYWQLFPRYGRDFLNCHIWTWNLEFEEKSQSCICTPCLPQGVKLSLFSLYEQLFSRY